jgi:hypothetical protein
MGCGKSNSVAVSRPDVRSALPKGALHQNIELTVPEVVTEYNEVHYNKHDLKPMKRRNKQNRHAPDRSGLTLKSEQRKVAASQERQGADGQVLPLSEANEALNDLGGEEGNYSPEALRDEEQSNYDDADQDNAEILRNAQYQRTIQAREEALRMAAALAAKEEADMKTRENILASLDGAAADILAKYA